MTDRLIADVSEAASSSRGGVRLIQASAQVSGETRGRLEADLTRLGFVIVDTTAAGVGVDKERLHRHVVLWCLSEGGRHRAVSWIRALARTSPRLHLVIWPASATVQVEQEEPVSRPRQVAMLRRAERLHAHGRTSAARAWLRSLIARDGLDWATYERTGILWADLLAREDRKEEASAWISSLEAESIIRGGFVSSVLRECREQATIAVRPPASKGQSMVSVEGLGSLCRALEDAPDEFTSAAAGCAWLRRYGPGVNVAIVADHGRPIASCGWKPGELAASPGDAHLSVPVKHGGATIAHVIVGGTGHDVATREGAQALAMLAAPAVRSCLDALNLRLLDREDLHDVLGRSQAIVDVRTAIAKAAVTPFAVLIEGESGTGKELAARAIHKMSARRDRRFLAVNCAALTDELIEAELFGHARGAFTGAVGPRSGMFEDAHGGTLFLDEVAELSPRGQAKLLRVLQEREIRRVGESASRPIDVRIVAATNTPLAGAAAQGRFRDDLRFRLAVVPIRLPALRDRVEDIPLLTHVFWRRALAETGKRAFLGPDALALLAQYSWPGNVRELQNVIAGLAVAAPVSGRVTRRHVAQVLTHVAGGPLDEIATPQPLDAARVIFERRHVAATMARHAGRRSKVARELGLTRQGLAKTLRRLGLDTDGPAEGVA